MNPYQSIPGAVPMGYSAFNLSHKKDFTCDFGQLIPAFLEECLPGDIMEIGVRNVIRFQPILAPIMHEVNWSFHVFFVPNRLMWPKPDYTADVQGQITVNTESSWEQFITGGVDGLATPTPPLWTFSGAPAVNSLEDYFGLPLVALGAGSYPSGLPRRAYNFVWNWFYRDENLQVPVDLDADNLLLRSWEKDYFTAALPFQQRGTAPALPITIGGSSAAIWPSSDFLATTPPNPRSPSYEEGSADPTAHFGAGNAQAAANALAQFNNNTVAGSGFSATSFSITDLRLAAALQQFMEISARGGYRYFEYLQTVFKGRNLDNRLNQPVYVGGAKGPIITSEVLQTSATSGQPTPQGNLAGHGISAGSNFCGKYRADEHGWLIGMFSVMPRSQYSQGVERYWLRRVKEDYYNPFFANLSEQGIKNIELFAGTSDTVNQSVFGYQGHWDEYRSRRSLAVGEMRTTFAYWNLARQFSSLPSLNANFIQLSAAELPSLKRIFADTTDPGLIVSHGNLVKAIRRMPVMPRPGMGRI